MSAPLKMDPIRLNKSERRAVKQAKASPWIAFLALPLFVAAIWLSDWRWAATGALALVASVVLWGWTAIKMEAVKRARADLGDAR